MKLAPTWTAMLVLLAPGVATPVEEQNPGVAAPPSGASAPSVPEAFRSLRNKLGGGSRPADPAASAAAAGDVSAAPASPPRPASGPSLKIKEFAPGSRLAKDWNDTHCRNLVEPFDLTDSAASLGKLKAQGLLGSVVGKVTGQRPARGESSADIRAAARQLNWLPMAVEKNIGDKMHAGQTHLLRESSKSGKELYARARRLLDEVVAQVREPTPYTFQVFVTTASEGNAESGPGGYIYVDKNLVEKASEEPRARFAIAHEVSHVLQRHRTRETQMRLADGVDSMEGLAKLMSSVRASPGAVLTSALDLKRLFVRHSEEQELQADGCAVRLIDGASKSPAEMIASINAFVSALPPTTPAQTTPQVTADAVFTELSDGQFSRHPSTEQRVRNLKAVLAGLRPAK